MEQAEEALLILGRVGYFELLAHNELAALPQLAESQSDQDLVMYMRTGFAIKNYLLWLHTESAKLDTDNNSDQET